MCVCDVCDVCVMCVVCDVCDVFVHGMYVCGVCVMCVRMCVCARVCVHVCVCVYVCVGNGRRLMPGSQTEGRQCCLVFLENSQFSVVLM